MPDMTLGGGATVEVAAPTQPVISMAPPAPTTDLVVPVSGPVGNGIDTVSLHDTSGLVKTYLIAFTDGTHFDFGITDGTGISGIALHATAGLTETYRITLTDGSHFDFDVTGGEKGDRGLRGFTGDAGVVQAIVAGDNITVDDADPANPKVSAEDGSQWDDVAGGLNYADGNVGVAGKLGVGTSAPTQSLDILGGLGTTHIRMGYAAGASAYANFIRNSFSGSAGGHTMTFVLRQNNVEHEMLKLGADGKVVFGGSPIFGGDVGINIGSATPKASLYVGSKAGLGYSNIEVLSFGFGPDSSYSAGFRVTVSGNGEALNAHTFHVDTGVGGGTSHDVYTARGDGMMIFPAGSGPVLTSPDGSLWRLSVSDTGEISTEGVE